MNTIAILYPGDMGGNVARALIGQKFRVVTCLAGRSGETKTNAMKLGVEALASLGEVALVSDLVVSLVPPNAVTPVAAAYIPAATGVAHPARFVDMNAKSIAVAEGLSEMFAGAGIPFTNACIIGRASHIREEGVIYASGERSDELERLVGQALHIVWLGGNVSAATAFKMCFAGFNKTITAAIFEIFTAANHFGVTERLFEQIAGKMPGVVSDIERIIGSYPRHLPRRRQEMEELARTLADASLPNHVALAAAAALTEIERRGDFDGLRDDPDVAFLPLMKTLHA